MPYREAQRFCDNCGRLVLARQRTPNHLVHAIVTLLLLGLWLIPWIVISASASTAPWLCQICGGVTRHPERLPGQRSPPSPQGTVRGVLVFIAIAIVAILVLGWFAYTPQRP